MHPASFPFTNVPALVRGVQSMQPSHRRPSRMSTTPSTLGTKQNPTNTENHCPRPGKIVCRPLSASFLAHVIYGVAPFSLFHHTTLHKLGDACVTQKWNSDGSLCD